MLVVLDVCSHHLLLPEAFFVCVDLACEDLLVQACDFQFICRHLGSLLLEKIGQFVRNSTQMINRVDDGS